MELIQESGVDAFVNVLPIDIGVAHRELAEQCLKLIEKLDVLDGFVCLDAYRDIGVAHEVCSTLLGAHTSLECRC